MTASSCIAVYLYSPLHGEDYSSLTPPLDGATRKRLSEGCRVFVAAIRRYLSHTRMGVNRSNMRALAAVSWY